MASKKKAGKPAEYTSTGIEASGGLAEVIGRALIDKQFREQLYTDREAALRGFHLSKGDLRSLKNLEKDTLDAHANALGAGERALRIAVKISKSF